MPVTVVSPQLFHSLLKVASTAIVDSSGTLQGCRKALRHGPFSATLTIFWAVLRKPRGACPAAVYPQLCHKPFNRSRGQPATIGRRFFPQPPRTGPLAKKPAMPGSPRRFARAAIHRQLFHSFPAPRSTAIVGNSAARMDQGKCLKIKACRKNQDKKRTAARRPRRAWREGIHSHFIHSKANRFRGQNPARRTNPERPGPAQRPCARQPPAHSPATGCAQGFRQIRWTTQATAPITWRMSCASASTRSTSVSQEHMKRAPPAPMKV